MLAFAAVGLRVVTGVEAIIVVVRVEEEVVEAIEEPALGLVLERRDHWGQAEDLDQDERCFHCFLNVSQMEVILVILNTAVTFPYVVVGFLPI